MDFVSRTKRDVGYGVVKDDNDRGIDNEDNLNDRLSSIQTGALNGSFERVSGSDPTSVTITTTGTGSYAIDEATANVRHGFRSLALTTAAVDDTVQVDWDYTACAPGDRIEVPWHFFFSAATLTLKVELLWYYWNGSAFVSATTASTTLYDASTGNPTSWARRTRQAVAPSGANPARYYRLRFTFGKAGAATTGTVHLDGVDAYVFHGFVSVSRIAKTSGTVDLSGDVETGEQPHRAQFGVYLLGGRDNDVETNTTMTSSGNGKTSMNAATYGLESEYLVWEVDLDDNLQCTITITLGDYGSPPSSTPDYDLWLLGYYV